MRELFGQHEPTFRSYRIRIETDDRRVARCIQQRTGPTGCHQKCTVAADRHQHIRPFDLFGGQIMPVRTETIYLIHLRDTCQNDLPIRYTNLDAGVRKAIGHTRLKVLVYMMVV